MRFANHAGVFKTTFDNLDELDSIKAFLPSAQLFLRIHANYDEALLQLGDKFGAPSEATSLLLKRAWELGLEVVGVSFHVGKRCHGEVYSQLTPKALGRQTV